MRKLVCGFSLPAAAAPAANLETDSQLLSKATTSASVYRLSIIIFAVIATLPVSVASAESSELASSSAPPSTGECSAASLQLPSLSAESSYSTRQPKSSTSNLLLSHRGQASVNTGMCDITHRNKVCPPLAPLPLRCV
jgi:hypothetical protein